MCVMIKGENGIASTIFEAVEIGYFVKDGVVSNNTQAKRPDADSCFCGVDVEASLDAVEGQVWEFNGNDYIVHVAEKIYLGE